MTRYNNPAPVAVITIPIEDKGVLCIKRGTPPHIGKWALPGGFIERPETWQEACVRELREETGLIMKPDNIVPLDVQSTERHLLVFGLAPVQEVGWLQDFKATTEALEYRIMASPTELCFETHTRALRNALCLENYQIKLVPRMNESAFS